MKYCIIDKRKDHCDVVIEDKSIYLPTNGRFLDRSVEGIEYYYLFFIDPSKIEPVVGLITNSIVSGSYPIYRTGGLNFINTYTELVNPGSSIQRSCNIVFIKYDPNAVDEVTYILNTDLPVLTISGVKHPLQDNLTIVDITINDIDTSGSTPKISPIQNDKDTYSVFNIGVNIDLDLWISKCANYNIDLTLFLVPFMSRSIIIEPLSLQRIRKSNLYNAISSKGFIASSQTNVCDVIATLPDGKVSCIYKNNIHQPYVYKLSWYSDDTFASPIEEPRSLTDLTNYYVRVNNLYPEGNYTPLLESSNNNVTITNVEDDKFTISVGDLSGAISSVTLTYGFNDIQYKHRRLTTLPINL